MEQTYALRVVKNFGSSPWFSAILKVKSFIGEKADVSHQDIVDNLAPGYRGVQTLYINDHLGRCDGNVLLAFEQDKSGREMCPRWG